MARLKSPIGQASASGLTRSPAQTTARGSGYLLATVDKDSIRRLNAVLLKFPKKVRTAIAKDALRPWAQLVRKAARRFAYKNADRTRKQLFYKVKTYRRAVWAAVGVRAEKTKNTKAEQRLGRYSPYVGWKSHFMEVGWHAFPKGKGGNIARREVGMKNMRIAQGQAFTKRITVYRKGKPHVRTIKERASTISQVSSTGGGGRGWRRGVRGYKGTFQSQYARHYLYKAAMVGKASIRRLMNKAVGRAIIEARKGAA
jgi:hypothetical protein